MQENADKQKPARDVREQPTPNPNGDEGRVKPPPAEVPPAGEHIPAKSPEKAKQSAADRGGL